MWLISQAFVSPSSLYRPLSLPTRFVPTMRSSIMIGVPFPRRYLLQVTAFFPVSTSFVLCFSFYVLLLSFWVGFLWCLSALDYGFGMFVFGIAFMAAVYYSRVSSVYVNPRGSIPFPRILFIVVFSCVTSPSPRSPFVIFRHPRHLLLISFA